MRPPSRFLPFVILLALISGLLCVVLPGEIFNFLRTAAGQLSPDGRVDSLSPERTASLEVPLRVLGALAAAGSTAVWIWRKNARAAAASLSAWFFREWLVLKKDFADLFLALMFPKDEFPWLVGLGAVVLAGLLLRLPYLAKPMGHDEAYTYLAFASRPLLAGISDYHLPNNHLFYTLLAHFSTGIFGSSPWALRLPALVSGVLLIPFAYLVGRQQYNRAVGLSAAGLTAALPLLVDISTSARGYSLITLLAAASFFLAAEILRRDNLAAWLLLVICGALGMWAVPVMLYPLGSAFTWLGLAGLLHVALRRLPTGASNSRQFFSRLAASGILTILLTLVLYLPVFLSSGVAAVTSNSFVLPLTLGDLLEVLPGRAAETYDFWFGSWWPGGGWLVLAGFLFSIIFSWRGGWKQTARTPTTLVRDGGMTARGQTIPLQLAVLVFCAAAVFIQRPNPWPKLWTSLLVPLLVWGCGGWVDYWTVLWAVLEDGKVSLHFHRLCALFFPTRSAQDTRVLIQAQTNSPNANQDVPRATPAFRKNPALLLSALICLLALGWTFRQTALTYPGFRVPSGAPEQAARFIQSRYQTGDLLAASSADGAALLYYMTHLGVDYPHPRELRRLTFQRVFIVVDSKENQSLESVVKDRQEDLGVYRLGNVVEQWEGESIAVKLFELRIIP